ncbi:unnamed protein product [Calicophoron daubneyi]|uniref:BTB domain-containing protein n=1 Tax=Calicophoron daubneyi TaxID=300641 RepID=A0AAV2T3J7_CALDB
MENVDIRGNLSAEGEDGSQEGRSEVYSVIAFTKMNAFRKRGQLCDVVIKVGGREFLAHRVVLAATSDYFDAMFSNGMAESAQLEVELKSISPDVMDALLDYVYTGQVHVTMENVQDLLPAASLVQMEGVKAACSNFLLAEVDASNVLGIRRFAELHNCAELEKFARNYAAHNFEMVVEYEEFLCLTNEELLDLITREDLHIDSEESVYKAVMRWVYHQAAPRAPNLPTLLRNIRLPVMSVRFLTDVVDKDVLIKQSLECRDLVDDAKRFHLRPDLRHEMRERRYRQRDGGDEYLVVIGGFGSDQNPSDSVEMFNPRTMEWSELPDLPVSYRYVAACSLDTCVYVIGGFDGRERLNTVCMLDIAQREEGWRWLTPMHYKRGLSAACTHKGLIYVCGGFDGQSRLRSLEVYHPKIDEWRILEDMTTAREGAGLVVVDESLYCLGGYDGFHLLNSMEAFDLRRGTWSVCKPMYMRRSGAGCALLGDTIYVCGGYGGAEGRGPLHLDTVEAYNTRLMQWTLVTSLNVPRCYVGACPLAGKIYVAAGYNGSRLLDTVESYDPIENVWWLHDDSRMNHERCDTGMCVVRFLSCAEPPQTSCVSSSTVRSPVPTSVGSTDLLPTHISNSPGTGTTASLYASSNRMGANRGPLDTSSYRIPMLPLTPHLPENISSLFRPPISAATSGQPVSTSDLGSVPRFGLPSSTALSIGAATTRGPSTSRARNLPFSSLRRHPHLPVRRQSTNPLAAPAPSQLPPAYLAPSQDLRGSRPSPFPNPRTTRQLVAVSTGGPITSSHWMRSVLNSPTTVMPTSFIQEPNVERLFPSVDECRNVVQNSGNDTSACSELASSVTRQTATNANLTSACHLAMEPPDDDIADHICPTGSAEVTLPSSASAGTEIGGNSSSMSVQSTNQIRIPIPFPNALHPLSSRRSSCSSPTLRTGMHSAGSVHGYGHTRHGELFRSAEALSTLTLEHRPWSDLGLTSGRRASDNNSDSFLTRFESRDLHFYPRRFLDDDRDITVYSDVLDAVPCDNLFDCLQLDEPSPDDRKEELSSDEYPDEDDNTLSMNWPVGSQFTPAEFLSQLNSLSSQASRPGPTIVGSPDPSKLPQSSRSASISMKPTSTSTRSRRGSQTKDGSSSNPDPATTSSAFPSFPDTVGSSTQSAILGSPFRPVGPSRGSSLRLKMYPNNNPASQLSFIDQRCSQISTGDSSQCRQTQGPEDSSGGNSLRPSTSTAIFERKRTLPCLNRPSKSGPWKPSGGTGLTNEPDISPQARESASTSPLGLKLCISGDRNHCTSSEQVTNTCRPYITSPSDVPSGSLSAAVNFPLTPCGPLGDTPNNSRTSDKGDGAGLTIVSSICPPGLAIPDCVSSSVAENATSVEPDAHSDLRSDGEGEEGDDVSTSQRNPAVGQTDEQV